MKFFCDAMLGHLGRKLRMAGYDTLIDDGKTSDRQLLEKARLENRILLSCDKKIQEIKDSKNVMAHLPQQDEESWAKFLSREYDVDWTHAPFTYCLECNQHLEALPKNEYYRLPLDIQQQGLTGYFCPNCKKVYWLGSHVKRMRKRLQQLKEL